MSREKLDTRNIILKSTLALLEASNGKDVRMSDIAKAAGISRQAVYLHFPTRSELLIATTRYLDDLKDVDGQFAAIKAKSGQEWLDAYISLWGNHIQHVHGVSKALIAMKDTDEAANDAWTERMQALRNGCAGVINAIKADGLLSLEYEDEQARDILWTLLSIPNWEQYRFTCGWTQDQYLQEMKKIARKLLIKDESAPSLSRSK